MTNQLSDNAKQLLEFIRARGGKGGNRSLQEQTTLDDQTYELVKQELLDSGTALRYRCRNGGLQLANQSIADTEISAVTVEATKRKAATVEAEAEKISAQLEILERDLYEPIKTRLLSPDYGYENVVIIGNSHRGSRWENPDLVAVEIEDYEWLVGFDVKITSFEVKLSFDIDGIWQAAHYRRFSHYVYLVCNEAENTLRQKESGRLFDAAINLGLGLMVFQPTGRGYAIREINAPMKFSPDLTEVDLFMKRYHDLLGLQRPGQVIIEQMHRK